MSGANSIAVGSPLGAAFDDAAPPSAQKPARKPDHRKRVKPLSVRLNAQERAAVEKAALGSPSMNAYLKSVLIGAGKAPIVKTRGKTPVKDFEALARVLGALGRSGIPDALERLVAAQERRASMMCRGGNAQVDNTLVQACADIAAMRRDLVAALGLKPV